MKKTAMTLIAAFLLSPLFMMARTSPTTSSPNPPEKQYTGYWVVSCGMEKIALREAAIPEEALVRDDKGEVVRLNMDVLDKVFNYTYQNTVQGKQVTGNQFVVVETTDKEQTGITVNTWINNCGSNLLCQAMYSCLKRNGPYSNSWITYNACFDGGKFCTADWTGDVTTFYIIACK